MNDNLLTTKTPGPDGCRADLVEWLSVPNRNSLISLYNDMTNEQQYPETFQGASLIAIYRKELPSAKQQTNCPSGLHMISRHDQS